MSNKETFSVPFQKHEVEEYERKRYRSFDQKIVDRREKKILRKMLEGIKDNSLLFLDIPCGFGRFSGMLIERGFSLVLSDLSFHMVKRAKEMSSLSGELMGVMADAKRGLPFKQKAFGFLLSMRFFHHVHTDKEREYILKEYSRVASRGVILSYYETNLLHLLQRRFRRIIKKSKTRIKMIARSKFQREAEHAGFHVVKISSLLKGIHAQHIALLRKS